MIPSNVVTKYKKNFMQFIFQYAAIAYLKIFRNIDKQIIVNETKSKLQKMNSTKNFSYTTAKNCMWNQPS